MILISEIKVEKTEKRNLTKKTNFPKFSVKKNKIQFILFKNFQDSPKCKRIGTKNHWG